jgi:heme oxygenase
MGPELNVALYTRVLQVLLPLVQGWELFAATAAPDAVKPLLADRRRGHLLEADLAALLVGADGIEAYKVDWARVAGGSAGDPDGHTDDPGSQASFLGCLYVMEGSTLGGRYLARHVESALHLAPGQGNAYFQGHGDQTGAMWRQVTAQLEAVPEEQSDRVIAAAKRTFRAFGEALRAGLETKAAAHG